MKKILEDFELFLTKHQVKISSLVPGFHPYFAIALWEMLQNGGKRFRPKLLFSTINSFCPDLIRKSFDIALALEVMHTYSLIHDDLPAMDNAALRRSNPTLHMKYDEASAILVGDGLQSYAFYLLSQADLDPLVCLKLVEILSRDGGISGMVAGQAMDCYFADKKLDLERLKIVHINKTAKLIAASFEMGGVICQLDLEILKRLREFGLELGLFFQIRDDLIDVTASELASGKSSQKDAFKNSYVRILGLDGAIKASKEQAQKVLEIRSSLPQELSQNLAFLDAFIKEKV
ncbi:MAG: polyprenyl synthetase family protein [Helicobacter sp.]|nr:polyprenyl synthetase family protein [Helicobacter sp.]